MKNIVSLWCWKPQCTMIAFLPPTHIHWSQRKLCNFSSFLPTLTVPNSSFHYHSPEHVTPDQFACFQFLTFLIYIYSVYLSKTYMHQYLFPLLKQSLVSNCLRDQNHTSQCGTKTPQSLALTNLFFLLLLLCDLLWSHQNTCSMLVCRDFVWINFSP